MEGVWEKALRFLLRDMRAEVHSLPHPLDTYLLLPLPSKAVFPENTSTVNHLEVK